ncbi:hypothetical protein HDU93_009651 [Gonapodya sp. JEL0774]|nr:hypothetical protein HDU93_009651 [Gonapodya sp. JEL0774]
MRVRELLASKDPAVDGLIFVPESAPYPDRSKYSGLFKWKDLREQSIDFVIRKSNGSWTLFVQERSGLVPFEPFPTLQVTRAVYESYPDGCIVELAWDPTGQTFRPRKQRVDKHRPNFRTVALEVWHAILTPVDINDLCGVVSEGNTSQPQLVERKIVFGTSQFAYNTRLARPSGPSTAVPPWRPSRKMENNNNMSAVQSTPTKPQGTRPPWKAPSVTQKLPNGSDGGSCGFRTMRLFHNSVKRAYITRAVKAASANRGFTSTSVATHNQFLSLLDLACGRCGDLQKWFSHSVLGAVVGVDNHEPSLVEAQRRIAQHVSDLSAATFHGKAVWSGPRVSLFRGDLTTQHIKDIVPGFRDALFDIVTCNFALHFFAKTEAEFDRFLDGVARSLRGGGVFLCMLFDGALVSRSIHTAGGISYIRRAPVPGNMRAAGLDHRDCGVDFDSEALYAPEKSFAITREGNNTTELVRVCVTGDEGNIMEAETLEALVYVDDLVRRAKAHGLELENTEVFGVIHDTGIADSFDLDPVERDFSALNRVYIFRRQARQEWYPLCASSGPQTTLESRIVELCGRPHTKIVARKNDDSPEFICRMLADVCGVPDSDRVSPELPCSGSWDDKLLRALAQTTGISIYRFEVDGSRRYFPGRHTDSLVNRSVIVADPTSIIGVYDGNDTRSSNCPPLVILTDVIVSTDGPPAPLSDISETNEPPGFRNSADEKLNWADEVEANEEREKAGTEQSEESDPSALDLADCGGDVEEVQGSDRVGEVADTPSISRPPLITHNIGDTSNNTDNMLCDKTEEEWTVQTLRALARSRDITVPVGSKRKHELFVYLRSRIS